MKKLVALVAIIFTLHSCNSGDRGELVGTQGKKMASRKAIWYDLSSRRILYYG